MDCPLLNYTRLQRYYLEGYLAHNKPHPPRTVQQAYAQGPTVILGRGAFSYERGTPLYDQLRSLRYCILYDPMDCLLVNYSRNALDAGFGIREPDPV